MDDPWYWSTDRVVQELCTPQRSWQPRATLKDLPASVSIGLENKLREEEVDGCMLLADVTHEVMKDDLDLKKLAWRVFVVGAIEIFRKRSAHYQQYRFEHHTDGHISSHHTASLAGIGYQLPQQIQIPPTPPAQSQQLPLIPNPVLAVRSLDQSGQASNTPITSRSARGEFVISDNLGNKRRKLDLTNVASNLALQYGDEAFYELPEPEQAEAPQAENSIPTPTPEPTDINSKKRKRVAPTLISLEIDPNRNRDIPTAADDVVHNDPQNIEPGVLFIGEDGRKRLVPVRQPDGNSDEPYDYQVLLQKSRAHEAKALDEGGEKPLNAAQGIVKKVDKKKALVLAESDATGYLGKKNMRVDDIFYKGIPVGKEIPLSQDSQEFSEGPKEISGGRRLYMHRVMKRYLHSERTVLLRDGKFFSAVRPYPASLTPRHYKPSFTLYYASEDGQIHARREELQSWPEVDPEAVPQKAKTDVDGNHVTFNISNSRLLDALGFGNDPLDPDLLEKYKYIDGGDEVLPLYGESDEENEYDMETWKEIEKEQGVLEKPLKKLAKPLLTATEVYDAIDEGIVEMVVKWHKQKLPKKLFKAFKIWKKYRLRPLRHEQLRKRQLGVDHMNQRIAKMRKEIAEELWTSKDKVRKQTSMLEPSIFDREDWAWEIRILESKSPPDKLPPRAPSETASKKSAIRSDDGEEGESIESHSDASSSDGDLSDFVVEDSPRTEDEKELNLADGEDEDDGATSDVSLPDISRKLPTSRKLIFKPSPTRSSRRSLQDDELMPNVPEDPFLSDDLNPDTLVKEEPILPKLPAASPNAGTEMNDITMISSDDGPLIIDLVTPRKKKTSILKLTNRNSPFAVSDSDDPQIPDPENLPSLENTAAIAKYSHRAWVNLHDRERLLISVLHGMPVKMRNSIFFLTSDTESQLWANLVEVMDYIRKDRDGVKGMDGYTIENLCVLIRLFAMFVKGKYYPYREKPSIGQVSDLPYDHAKYPAFYAFCRKIEGYFDQTPSPHSGRQKPDDEEDEEPRSAIRRRKAINTTDDDDVDPDQDTPHKPKRKKKVFEDVRARDLRERDRERLAAQQERRQRLQASQAEMGNQGGDGGDIIINESKLDKEGFVYVNPKIARRIKKHQIEGVRFMWNQIVTVENTTDDENTLSGCLLAHTMGLGKTMQVITLLVAIAEASSSTDESIFGQIPTSLRASKTLILCPPGLIDNWMDELLIWAPEGVLGELRKIDAGIPLHTRVDTVDDWYNDGGILVLGYEMFRGLVNNTKRKGTEMAALDEEQHAQVLKQLTGGPNIIIADEAHKLKNAAAAVTVAASQFRSRSRIALTGSPLANNIEEYHSMIEWVAPNYLGPAVEFRAKYVEPIQAGLYHDSNPYERRKSLTMLGVLKEDVSPKVHRADMSVLRNDLPPKKEFVITVPLTRLQSKAYSIYVKSMMANAIRNEAGDIAQTTLWHWLAILSLLCNHPASFMSKLTERKEDAKKGANASTPVSRDGTDQEDIGVDLNASHWKIGVSESLVHDEQKLFADEAADMKSIELSNKTKILCQILDASKAAGDKTLVFSQSIPTLDFLEHMCKTQGRQYARLDGSTPMSRRQIQTKQFNTGSTDIYLISTSAGGLGLNLWGANRVVIFDFKFNPILEEQAVGRAYRIGQQKDVFVYRFVAGGTFEDSVHNKAVFKKQLASRVVDKKKPLAWATKKLGDFLFEPKDVEQKDLSEFEGMDPDVLDKILACQGQSGTIRAIVQSDTFEMDDNDDLTLEEQKQVKQMLSDEKLKRSDPKAYHALLAQRSRAEVDFANAFRASLQAPVANLNPSAGVNNLPQRSASGPIRHPPMPNPNLSNRMSNHPTGSGVQRPASGPTRPTPRPSLGPSNRVHNHPIGLQRPTSGPIWPPPRPGSSSGARAVSAMQAPTTSSGGYVQPRSGPTIPRSSMGAPAASSRKDLSPILGGNTKILSDTPDTPESTSTSSSMTKPKGSFSNTPQVVTAVRSNEGNKPTGSNVAAESGHRHDNPKRLHRDTDSGGNHDKDKPAIDSEMYKAMGKIPSSVRPLRTPVTKPSGQKSKISSSRANDDPRVIQRVLQRQLRKIARQKSTNQPSNSTTSHPTLTPTPNLTPTLPSATSPKKARLPNWAIENINGASSRNGKHDSPASSRTTVLKD